MVRPFLPQAILGIPFTLYNKSDWEFLAWGWNYKVTSLVGGSLRQTNLESKMNPRKKFDLMVWSL
jgi:hypothetical protein